MDLTCVCADAKPLQLYRMVGLKNFFCHNGVINYHNYFTFHARVPRKVRINTTLVL